MRPLARPKRNKEKPRPKGRGFLIPTLKSPKALALEREAAETLVELGNLTTGIEKTLLTTGPGRVRERINVENHRVAFLAPGGARFKHGAVGHLDLDHVIVGMAFFFHFTAPVVAGSDQPWEID